MLLDDYRARVDQLFAEVRETQTENIIAAGKLVADAIAAGCNIYLSNICHYMEYDLLERGGGPTFYKPFRYALELKNYTTHYQARRRTDLPEDRCFYHTFPCIGGVMEEACGELLRRFFQEKRR